MKPKNKKRQGSLLTRLFKKENDKPKEPQSTTKKVDKGRVQPVKDAAKPAVTPTKPAAPVLTSALEYSIAEIKHLVAIGKKDPQRLALLVGNMLEAEKERQLVEKEAFDQLLQEIAAREPGRPD